MRTGAPAGDPASSYNTAWRGPMNVVAVTRRVRRIDRRFREARMMARAPSRIRAARSSPISSRPAAATSPAPTAASTTILEAGADAGVIERRVDALAALGTGIVTMSGGEPLLHPELEAIVRRVRRRGMIATVITNGYPLTRERIARAEPRRPRPPPDQHRQPHAPTRSREEPGDPRREAAAARRMGRVRRDRQLRRWAGGGDPRGRPGHRAARPGARLLDDGRHHPRPRRRDAAPERTAAADPRGDRASSATSPFDFSRHSRFQRNLTRGRPNDWRCRAGCRYLYVCEDGLVHWCSQQRGQPGVPLERYGQEDLEREHRRVKPCAPRCASGACTVSRSWTNSASSRRARWSSGSARPPAGGRAGCRVGQVPAVGVRRQPAAPVLPERGDAGVRHQVDPPLRQARPRGRRGAFTTDDPLVEAAIRSLDRLPRLCAGRSRRTGRFRSDPVGNVSCLANIRFAQSNTPDVSTSGVVGPLGSRPVLEEGGAVCTAVRSAGSILVALACLVLFPLAASAQSSLAGLVRDESGGVLPGVTVEAASPVLIEKVRTA